TGDSVPAKCAKPLSDWRTLRAPTQGRLSNSPVESRLHPSTGGMHHSGVGCTGQLGTLPKSELDDSGVLGSQEACPFGLGYPLELGPLLPQAPLHRWTIPGGGRPFPCHIPARQLETLCRRLARPVVCQLVRVGAIIGKRRGQERFKHRRASS